MATNPINPGDKNKKASSTKTMRLLTSKGKDGSPASTSRRRTRSENQPIQFPIVGIGASDGGLAAFEAFFSGMPTYTEPGMAFVLVQHLEPGHKNILTGLIQRYTPMQVSEVEDGMQVRINCIYIIPPGRDMTFQDGTLRLHEPSAPRGQRLPIDSFFRSLARDQHERAICIVLSGTGSDGTLGVRAIKGEGGMTMAQDPDSTEYDGMPCSAIATGLVDYQLPPAEMPAQLMAYVAHAFSNHSQSSLVQLLTAENTRQTIYHMLQGATGHDFSQYKQSTMIRRIEGRMAIHQIKSMDRYVEYLQQTPAELEALFRDMLIGVTGFSRDPETFKALEKQIIPELVAEKPAGAVVRVWSAGCSTGEDYSLARLPSPHVGDRILPQLIGRQAGPGKLTLRELTERTLLQLAAPTGALVNGRGDILYLHGRTGMYLQTNPGEVAVNNILQMAREGLRDELTSALNRATTSGEVVRRTGLQVSTNGVFITVNLTIMKVVTGPAPTPEAPLYLIFLEEVGHLQLGKSD